MDPPVKPLTIKESKRFAPTTVAVMLRWPEGFAKTYSVSAALGSVIRRDSTFAPLRHGQDGIAVHISPNKRKRICDVLGITLDHYSDFARRVEDEHIGHRCRVGVLCLWLEPLEESCPGCGKEVLVR